MVRMGLDVGENFHREKSFFYFDESIISSKLKSVAPRKTKSILKNGKSREKDVEKDNEENFNFLPSERLSTIVGRLIDVESINDPSGTDIASFSSFWVIVQSFCDEDIPKNFQCSFYPSRFERKHINEIKNV